MIYGCVCTVTILQKLQRAGPPLLPATPAAAALATRCCRCLSMSCFLGSAQLPASCYGLRPAELLPLLTCTMMAFRAVPWTSISFAEVMYRSLRSAFSSLLVASRSNRAYRGSGWL